MAGLFSSFRICAISILLLVSNLDANASTDACVALLQHGLYNTFRNATASANASQAQQNLCSQYNQYKSDKQAGSVKASYAAFSGGADFSREQMEAIGSAMCEASYSANSANANMSTLSTQMDPGAVQAYRDCVEKASGGLNADTVFDEVTGEGFSLNVYYVPPVGTNAKITFGGIILSNRKGINCQGSLTTLSVGAEFKVNQTYQLDCRRAIEPTPVDFQGQRVWAKPYVVTVGTSAGSIVRTISVLPTSLPTTPQLVPVGTLISFNGTMQQAEAQTDFGWWVADGRVVKDPASLQFNNKPTPDLKNRFLLGTQLAGNFSGAQKASVPAQTINSHTTGVFGQPDVYGDPFTHMQGPHTWNTSASIYSAGDFRATDIDLPLPPHYTVIYLMKVK